jgi:hypothetical protein
MDELIIKVNDIEEWQTIRDLNSLDLTFDRAKRILVGGGTVTLIRIQPSGESYKFEHFTTLEDLQTYKNTVYKYL